MNIQNHFSLKTAGMGGLIAALLSITVGCATVSPSYDGQSVYRGTDSRQNVSFNRVSQQLRQELRRKGYQVMDIKADSYRGNRAITAYAKKGNQLYELRYTYPSLKLINASKKAWPNPTKNNKYQKDTQRRKDDNRYDKNYRESDIKRESRYPVIKRRAVNKVEAMGYRVKDIELDEKNKRGVFEVEARRGSQDYEILLSYPELNVLKIKKD